MPIYEYRCRKCGETFELIRRLATRDDAAPCPACKSKTPRRVQVQQVALLQGAAPNAMAGEGEAEDFLDMDDDDFGGMGF